MAHERLLGRLLRHVPDEGRGSLHLTGHTTTYVFCVGCKGIQLNTSAVNGRKLISHWVVRDACAVSKSLHFVLEQKIPDRKSVV